jgi:hypothetical protein
MVQCPVCRVTFVANTLFCTECGLYLPKGDQLNTEPLEREQVKWGGEAPSHLHLTDRELPEPELLTLRLLVRHGDQATALRVELLKPVRLGRMDPRADIFPEVDLTDCMGQEAGVSREHACIFRRGNIIEVEDLGSTNGTLVNGERLSPYIPEILKDGDRLQLGKLLIEVCLELHPLPRTPPGNRFAPGEAV